MSDFKTVPMPLVDGNPFVPDRWIEDDPAVAQQMERWTRSCVGLTWWRDEMRRGWVFRLPVSQIREP